MQGAASLSQLQCRIVCRPPVPLLSHWQIFIWSQVVLQMRIRPDTVFKVSWGKHWALILLREDSVSVNNSSSPASVITRGLTQLFLAHPNLWQLAVLDKITVWPINAQKLARTGKQRKSSIISPVVILPPACPLMGLHWKSSRLTALGLINPVICDKDGAGESKLQPGLPCWAPTWEHCSNLVTSRGISHRERWHHSYTLLVKVKNRCNGQSENFV